MHHPVEAMLADPWGALGTLVDGPLHPGGGDATEDLLDRAGVDSGTRLLDIGCGAGESLAIARERGAEATGLDRRPDADGTIRGDLASLPVGDGRVDVVLAECVLCLCSDVERSIAEAERVLIPGGRLALSDVVVEGEAPDLPETISRALCLSGPRGRAETIDRIERAGFEVGAVQDHGEDLLAMRDRIQEQVDYEGLLGLLGERGERLLDGIADLEAAIEDGEIGYVSVVATA
ncbi:MAG: class I SAM-dependent methyltransferase [Halobacteriales archaeon]